MAGRTSCCPECTDVIGIPAAGDEAAETVEETVDPAALAPSVARLNARWPGRALPGEAHLRTLG